MFACNDPDVLSKNRIAEHKETGESVGFGCPNCGIIMEPKFERLAECPHCHHKLKTGKRSRPIMQANGKIVQVSGEPIKKWKIKEKPENQKIWDGLYWHALKNQGGDVTFNELYQRFHYKTSVLAGSLERPAFWHGYYPPRNLGHMPTNPNDWHAKVGDVARRA